jgi:hypothetical protein
MAYNVQQRLDAFVSGECGAAAFLHELFVLCDATPDSAWEILSLVDQYYRRGKLSVDQFQTLRCRIERHVLGVRDSDITPELSDAHKATEATVASVRGGALATAERAATAQELASDVRASRVEPLHARATMQRYRKRITIVPDLRHHTRSAFAYTQRDLGVLHRQAARYFKRPRYGERRHPLSRRFNREPTGVVVTPDRLCARWLVVVAFLVSAGASPVLHDLTSHRGSGKMALPTPVTTTTSTAAAAVVIPQIASPGQISLSTDRYIVSPGHVSAVIYVQRIGGASGDVSFVWWTQGSGAKPGQDYVSRAPRVAHMLDGVDTLQLAVPILVNPTRKHTELFYVVIGKPGGGASLGSASRAAVFIMRRD